VSTDIDVGGSMLAAGSPERCVEDIFSDR